MKLYYSPGACSLAPHIVLREADQQFTLEKVDIASKKTETGADFLAVNPKGYVPTLMLDDGDVLTEGVVIQNYIADRAPASGLAPAAGTKARLKLEELQLFLTTEVHKSFGPLFSPAFSDETKATFKERIGQRFDTLNAMFADGRPYTTGEAFTTADAYLFTLSNWTRFTGMDLGRWPNLAAFAGRTAQRPAVQAALKAEGLA